MWFDNYKTVRNRNTDDRQVWKIVPSVVGNKYLVFGTLDKNQWLKYSKTPTDPSAVVGQVYVFKDVLKFELAPRGWYKDDSLKK